MTVSTISRVCGVLLVATGVSVHRGGGDGGDGGDGKLIVDKTDNVLKWMSPTVARPGWSWMT